MFTHNYRFLIREKHFIGFQKGICQDDTAQKSQNDE